MISSLEVIEVLHTPYTKWQKFVMSLLLCFIKVRCVISKTVVTYGVPFAILLYIYCRMQT